MFERIKNHSEELLGEKGELKNKLKRVVVGFLSSNFIDFETLIHEASESGLSEDQFNRIRAAEQDIHDTLVEVFQSAMDRGEIAESNLLLAHAFTSVTMIRNRNEIMRKIGGPYEAAEQLIDLFWSGIKK